MDSSNNREYDRAVQVNSSGKSIHLPEELLVDIFKTIVKYDPLAIGQFLFVSRYWYNLIRSTPSLWSRILIAPRIPNDVKKCTQYVIVALENSAENPLEVIIDLRLFTDSAAEGDDKPPSNSQGELDRMAFTKLFQSVVGNDGSNMARWKSFRFRIPYLSPPHNAFREFMKGLKYTAPHLESLSVQVDHADVYASLEDGPLDDLRRLKSLTVDAAGHLGSFNYIPANIEILSFRLWDSPDTMSRFLNLRHLLLVIAFCAHTRRRNPVIVFPFLESLTLDVWEEFETAKELVSRIIQAPLLTTLRLINKGSLWAMKGGIAFPQVDTLDLLSDDEKPDAVLEFIHASLPSYPTLSSLTVCPWHLEGVMNGLRSLKDQGRVPVHLDTVYTIVSDNEGILLDHSTAEKVVIMGRLPSEYLYRSHSLSGYAVQ